MDILVSVKPGVGRVTGLSTPVELDIRGLPDLDKFLPLLAVELEDLGLRIEQVRVGYLRRKGDVERLLRLLDYLNVDLMVARPAMRDVESVAEVLDEASMYGIRVTWEFGVGRVLRTPEEVFEFANNVAPHRVRLALHVAREGGLRDFVRRFVELSGYVKTIYFSNKRGGVFGLPIFDGSIDYLRVTKILQVLRYEDNVVLQYQPSYYSRYATDVEVLSTFMNSLGNEAADRRLIKSLERIVGEVLGQGL
ncbi:MAG: hypothetical protein L7H00_01330 [Vulcanisaeta sp.]|nr:hypothetical protein [Vulcanisaeta sp.]